MRMPLRWLLTLVQNEEKTMKKALLASTALVAMSGAAFADDNMNISLSGFAEMGIADGGSGDAMFHQDVDVRFKMSSTTDAGLTFGTEADLDDAAKLADKAGTNHGLSIFVNGPFGNFNLGDTDGAFDWALDEVGGAGAIADNHTGHAGFNGNAGLDGGRGENDGQILRYDNSFGALSVALSYEQEDGHASGDIIGVGVKGGFGDVNLGVGFQAHDDEDIAGASVSASFGDIKGVANFSRLTSEMSEFESHMAVGATYATGATTVNVNFGQHNARVAGTNDKSGLGIAATYDLGGGASMQFGYGNSQNADDTETDTWSLGLAMSF